MHPNHWADRPPHNKPRRRHFYRGHTPPKNRVCVTWPIFYGTWTVLPRHRSSRCSWWETIFVTPGKGALVTICEKALQDGVEIAKAVRCAEAAGLFRRSPEDGPAKQGGR